MPSATRAATAYRFPGRRPRALLFGIVGRGFAEGAGGPLHQERFDEQVNVAVEHAVDVSDLLFGSMILDQLIRMEDVAANLAAKRDVLLRAADLIELCLLLLELDVVQPRLQ